MQIIRNFTGGYLRKTRLVGAVLGLVAFSGTLAASARADDNQGHKQAVLRIPLAGIFQQTTTHAVYDCRFIGSGVTEAAAGPARRRSISYIRAGNNDLAVLKINGETLIFVRITHPARPDASEGAVYRAGNYTWRILRDHAEFLSQNSPTHARCVIREGELPPKPVQEHQ